MKATRRTVLGWLLSLVLVPPRLAKSEKLIIPPHVTRTTDSPMILQLRDGSGIPMDLTAAPRFDLTVENPISGSLDVYSGEITDPLDGRVEFQMPEFWTDRFLEYRYDIQMTDSDGHVRTINHGTVA